MILPDVFLAYPLPWQLVAWRQDCFDFYEIEAANGQMVMAKQVELEDRLTEFLFRRIVDCVNACRDVPAAKLRLVQNLFANDPYEKVRHPQQNDFSIYVPLIVCQRDGVRSFVTPDGQAIGADLVPFAPEPKPCSSPSVMPAETPLSTSPSGPTT